MPADGMSDLTDEIGQNVFGHLYYVYSVLLPLVEALPGYFEAVLCVLLPFLIVTNERASVVQVLKDLVCLLWFLIAAGPIQAAREVFGRVRQLQGTPSTAHEAERGESGAALPNERRGIFRRLIRRFQRKTANHESDGNQYEELKQVHPHAADFSVVDEVSHHTQLPSAPPPSVGYDPSQDPGSVDEYGCQPSQDSRL